MKLSLAKAILVLMVLLGTLSGVSYALQLAYPSDVPRDPVTQAFVNGLIIVFVTSANTPLWVFVRNVYGYLAHKYGDDPDVEYEASKFTATYIRFEGMIKGYTGLALLLFAGTPVHPYAAMIAGSFAFVTDLVRSMLENIGAKKTASKLLKK